MNEDEFREWVEAHEWVFAKTMPEVPHWYVARPQARDQHEFMVVARFIRENGRFGHYYGKPRRYYDLGDYFYWSMGWPYPETLVINRAEQE